MNRINKNEGITLLEVILVVALLAIVAPVTITLISNSFKESNTLSDKVKIQTSVVALLNKFEQTIKEADIPIAESNFQNNKLLISNANGETLFTYVPEKQIVTCEEKDLDGNIINKIEYSNITHIDFKLQSGGYGAMVELSGGEDENKYSLSNVYYSRNTLSYKDFLEEGEYLLTTIINGKSAGNAIVSSVSRLEGEEIVLTASSEGFDRWIVTTENVLLQDVTSSITKFNMPAQDVTIVASFKY